MKSEEQNDALKPALELFSYGCAVGVGTSTDVNGKIHSVIYAPMYDGLTEQEFNDILKVGVRNIVERCQQQAKENKSK